MSAEAIAEARKKELDRLRFSSKFLRFQELEIELEEHRTEIARLRAVIASDSSPPIVVGKLRLSTTGATGTPSIADTKITKTKPKEPPRQEVQVRARVSKDSKDMSTSITSGTAKAHAKQPADVKKESFVAKTRRRAQEAEYYKQVRLAQLEAECELEENIHIRTARAVKARMRRDQALAQVERQRATDEVVVVSVVAVLAQDDDGRDGGLQLTHPSDDNGDNKPERDVSNPPHSLQNQLRDSELVLGVSSSGPDGNDVSTKGQESYSNSTDTSPPEPKCDNPVPDCHYTVVASPTHEVKDGTSDEDEDDSHDDRDNNEVSEAAIYKPPARGGVHFPATDDDDPLEGSELEVRDETDDKPTTLSSGALEDPVDDPVAEYSEEGSGDDIVAVTPTSPHDGPGRTLEQLYAEENFDDTDDVIEEVEATATSAATVVLLSGDVNTGLPSDSAMNTEDVGVHCATPNEDASAEPVQGFLLDPIDPHLSVALATPAVELETVDPATESVEHTEGFLVDVLDPHTTPATPAVKLETVDPAAERVEHMQGFLVDVLNPHTTLSSQSAGTPREYADEEFVTDSPREETGAPEVCSPGILDNEVFVIATAMERGGGCNNAHIARDGIDDVACGGDDGVQSGGAANIAFELVPGHDQPNDDGVMTRQLASGLESADAADRQGGVDVMSSVKLGTSMVQEAMNVAAKKIQQFWRDIDARFRRDGDTENVKLVDGDTPAPVRETLSESALESPRLASPREDEPSELNDDDDVGSIGRSGSE